MPIRLTAAVPPFIFNGRRFKMTAQRTGFLIYLNACYFHSSLLDFPPRLHRSHPLWAGLRREESRRGKMRNEKGILTVWCSLKLLGLCLEKCDLHQRGGGKNEVPLCQNKSASNISEIKVNSTNRTHSRSTYSSGDHCSIFSVSGFTVYCIGMCLSKMILKTSRS